MFSARRGAPVVAAAALFALAVISWLRSSLRAGHVGGGADRGAARVPGDRSAGGGARYLVLADPPRSPSGLLQFGRFSNQRQQLLEALALANATGRTLLAPGLAACSLTPLGVLYDLDAAAAAGARLRPAAQIRAACGDAGVVRLALSNVGGSRLAWWQTPFAWAGLSWPVAADFSAAVAAAPPHLTYLAARSAAPRTTPVYQTLVTQPPPFPWLGLAALPWWLARYSTGSADSCVLVEAPFFAVNLAAVPGAFEAAVRALAPAPPLAAAVGRWFATHNLQPHRVVAVHLRLGDIAAAGWSAFVSDACTRLDDVQHAFAPITDFIARLALSRAPVLLASDELDAPCAQALARHLASDPATRVVLVQPADFQDGRLPPIDDCSAAILVHETLAQSAAFIGIRASSFSAAIHQIRLLRHGASPETSLLLE